MSLPPLQMPQRPSVVLSYPSYRRICRDIADAVRWLLEPVK